MMELQMIVQGGRERALSECKARGVFVSRALDRGDGDVLVWATMMDYDDKILPWYLSGSTLIRSQRTERVRR
jgi:hypothetical protein